MRNLMFIFFFLCTNCISAYSTVQIPDRIIYNGNSYYTLNFPLELYFEKYNNKPSFIHWTSTALWRGYVAVYEIVDNQLFVKNIDVEKGENITENIISRVFPEQTKVKMDWYSGLFVIPVGKLKDNFPNEYGYSTKYDKYIVCEVKHGNIIKEKSYNFKEYKKLKKALCLSLKKSNTYNNVILKIQNNSTYEDCILNKKDIKYIIKYRIFDYVNRFPEENE